MQKKLVLKQFEDFAKAITLLESSIKKYKPFDANKIYSPEELEFYDSLSFRYEKAIEVALSFFRSLEMYLYSKCSDTLRNRLLNIEKIGLIGDMETWMEVRLLRNKISHAYLPDQQKDIYDEVIKYSKIIFQNFESINRYIEDKI